MKQLFLDAGFKMSKKVNVGNMTGPAPDVGVPFPKNLINPLLDWLAKNGIYFYDQGKGRSETTCLELQVFTKVMPQSYCTNVENGIRYSVSNPKMIIDPNLQVNQFLIRFNVIRRNMRGDVINMRG